MRKRTSFLNGEFRAQENEDRLYIEGYFMKFNQETNLFDDVYEEIDPDSITKSLKDGDIRALFNHDTNLILGRTENKTLELRVDEVGLYGKIEVNQEDPDAMGAYARIKRGDVAGCSFGFYPIKEDMQNRDGGGKKFIIREMDLFEVSPCVFPAYPQTEISARKQDIETMKREKFAVRKKELKERYC